MCRILYNQRRPSSPLGDLLFLYFLVSQTVVSRDEQLRNHVNYVLRGGGAHLDFDRAIDGLPVALRGITPAGLPHSAWQLVEHLRICQWDILEYSLDGRHESPDFPDGYWPSQAAPPTEDAWDRSVAAFRSDLKAMKSLVSDPSTDLLAPIPHGQAGHTILREALLVADHNAYHLGQLVMVRRALGDWQD
ncbi:MAG: DinB family protein [Planctomycetaceae bacterium]|nr:DinB family protein [Planctomycetaceae bacterium]